MNENNIIGKSQPHSITQFENNRVSDPSKKIKNKTSLKTAKIANDFELFSYQTTSNIQSRLISKIPTHYPVNEMENYMVLKMDNSISQNELLELFLNTHSKEIFTTLDEFTFVKKEINENENERVIIYKSSKELNEEQKEYFIKQNNAQDKPVIVKFTVMTQEEKDQFINSLIEYINYIKLQKAIDAKKEKAKEHQTEDQEKTTEPILSTPKESIRQKENIREKKGSHKAIHRMAPELILKKQLFRDMLMSNEAINKRREKADQRRKERDKIESSNLKWDLRHEEIKKEAKKDQLKRENLKKTDR